MAFDQSTRGRLQKLVNSCRGLLADEFSIQLQQTYGLDPHTGEVTPLARLIADTDTCDAHRRRSYICQYSTQTT